jgi:AcrR family transcriptional regulator
MAQQLKPEVDRALRAAALDVCARRGYALATMAEIARAAGVSTGNVYVYFENKDRLFRAVVDDEFVVTLTKLMLRKVRALRGVPNIAALSPDAPYRLLSEELLQFWIANRLRVVILLSGAAGTVHETFAEQTVDRLVQLALAYFAGVRPRPSTVMRYVLRDIYKNFVSAMVGVLSTYDDEKRIREATEMLTHYHLAGLKNVFAITAQTLDEKKVG